MPAAPLLATKLFRPPPRPAAVPRPALLARLSAGLHGRLTLISAPAGFGKTTLAAAWLASVDQPSAWLALDEEDGDPARFLAYLIAALQTIWPETGLELAALLASPQPPPANTLLAPLLTELAARDAPS
ncbi:MAG: LuxR family transcriptional regulator, partial [Candidatus Promineifilaceae bacterium]